MPRSISPLADRFWHYVEQGDGCWEWQGHLASGYGALRGQYPDQRMVKAHRVSWEIHFGPIPTGMFVCHHCDNPPCVRPDHLFLGTNTSNMRDRERKGRQGIRRAVKTGHLDRAYFEREYYGAHRGTEELGRELGISGRAVRYRMHQLGLQTDTAAIKRARLAR